MEILPYRQEDIAPLAAKITAELYTPGAVVLVPTETVYGLIARSDDEAACRRIYELKQRPYSKRNGWFTGNWRRLPEFGVDIAGLPEKLAQEFTPGALTVVAPTFDGGTQGFRVPDHPLLLAVLEKMDVPLVQTSANGSGCGDVLCVQEALSQLHGAPDLVIDGGDLPPGRCGSTVVDATGKMVKILRAGALAAERLEKYC